MENSSEEPILEEEMNKAYTGLIRKVKYCDLEANVNCLLVSKDGTLVFCGIDFKEKNIFAFTLRETKFRLIATLDGHKGPVKTIEQSINENEIISGGKDLIILIWDIINFTCKYEISTGHRYCINKIIQADNKNIISAGMDTLIKIFDFNIEKRSFNFLKDLEGHKGEVKSLVKIDKDIICSAGSDCSVLFWNINTLERIPNIRHIHALCSSGNALIYSKEKDVLILGGLYDLTIIDYKTKQIVRKVVLNLYSKAYVESIIELKNGNFLVGSKSLKTALFYFDKEWNLLEVVKCPNISQGIVSFALTDDDTVIVGDSTGIIVECTIPN